ncbi:MAG: sugar phosphate isomerase/epimerase family protein [Anaerolineae bacterium]
MKLAIQEDMLPGESLAEQFENAEKLGFEGVEFWSFNLERRVDEIKRVAAGNRVKPAAVCYGRRRCLLHPDREEREQAVAEIKEYLTLTAEIGAVGLVVVPIFGPPLLPDLSPLSDAVELEKKLVIELAGQLGQHAQEVGAVLLLESLNRYESHFLRTLQDAVEICKEVDNPYVQTMADLFHMSIEEDDIPASIAQAGQYIYHVHLADSNRKLPGLGHTDFAAAFAALKSIGYDKYTTLECGEPSQNAPLRGYYAQELPRCLEYLRGCL